MTMTLDRVRFDMPGQVDEDGNVTFLLSPSSWRRYNVSPDTYQTFKSDQWEEQQIEHWSDETGLDLNYDDFEWTYDHSGIVRDLSKELCDWLAVTLHESGVKDATVELVDTGSPREYNFTSDWWEARVTCNAAQLRDATPGFDVDEWVHRYYESVSGFISFVTGRMEKDDWRIEYDAAFRVEAILADNDPYNNNPWISYLMEGEWEIYERNISYELTASPVEDMTYTEWRKWDAYADELAHPPNLDPLF